MGGGRMPQASLDRPAEAAAREPPPVTEPNARLTERAFLNSIAALLDYFARIGAGFLITPVLVAGLGHTFFGVWEMLARLVGYLAAADGRPTQALRLVIANRQALDEPETKRGYVGSAVGVWLLFLPL